MSNTYTPITLEQMEAVLHADKGWAVQSDLTWGNGSPVKEYVFDWPLGETGYSLRVYSSVLIATEVTRASGTDAIRVCVPGLLKSKKIYRTQGWRDRLQARCREIVEEAKVRIRQKHSQEAKSSASAGSFEPIVAMLKKAATKLRRPKVFLSVDGVDIQFHILSAHSKYPGQIAVTDGGEFGSNKWFGRITEAGAWVKSGAVGDEEVALVEAFTKNPAEMAAKYGHKTGRCCFCSKKLTTEESTAVGYGPVCAKTYQLPWGKVSV